MHKKVEYGARIRCEAQSRIWDKIRFMIIYRITDRRKVNRNIFFIKYDPTKSQIQMKLAFDMVTSPIFYNS